MGKQSCHMHLNNPAPQLRVTLKKPKRLNHPAFHSPATHYFSFLVTRSFELKSCRQKQNAKLQLFSHFVLVYSSLILFPPWDRKHADIVILSEIHEISRKYRTVPSKLENEWVWNPFHAVFCYSKEKGHFFFSFFVFSSSSFMVHLCIWCCLKQV